MFSALPSLNRTVTHLRAPHMLCMSTEVCSRAQKSPGPVFLHTELTARTQLWQIRPRLFVLYHSLKWGHIVWVTQSIHRCTQAAQCTTVGFTGDFHAHPTSEEQHGHYWIHIKGHTNAHKLDLTWQIQSEQNTRGATRPTRRERIVAASTLLTRHRC